MQSLIVSYPPYPTTPGILTENCLHIFNSEITYFCSFAEKILEVEHITEHTITQSHIQLQAKETLRQGDNGTFILYSLRF
jgi:hypothetical protein